MAGKVKLLLVLGMVCTIALSAACGGNGDDTEPSPTPTATPAATPTTTPTTVMTSAEVISFVQGYQAVERVEGELWQVTLVSLASRVEKFCMDMPTWSAREGTMSWRVFAQCTRQESVPADNPLRFEWLFYPDSSLVMPHSHAAHVAQYSDPW